MALTDTETARLASLQAALDKLITGQQIAKVQTTGGRTVEYSKADIANLRLEIQALLDKQALPASTDPACPPRLRGAFGFRIR